MNSLARKINILRWMTLSDFKLRDQGSFLGFIWTLLNPVLMFLALYLVFNAWFGKLVENYPVYLIVGILHWNFFALATSNAVTIFDRKRHLLKSFNLSGFTLPVCSVFTIFISYLIESLIVLTFCAIYSGISFSGVVCFILILILNLIFTLGISLLLANAYIFIRDIAHLWAIALKIGFFITPVFYPLNFIDSQKLFILKLNPLYHLLNFSREALLKGSFELNAYFIYVVILSASLLFISAHLYKINHQKLVERL